MTWLIRLTIAATAIIVIIMVVDRGGDDGLTQVERVIDGDTFVLVGGDRIRVAYVDTPERGQPGFDEARQRTRELVADGVRCEPVGRSYDRIVGDCQLADGRWLHVVLFEEGLGCEDWRFSGGRFGFPDCRRDE